jgi:uncharacterized membrane protein
MEGISGPYRQAEQALASGFPEDLLRQSFLWTLRLVLFFFPFGLLFVGAGVLPGEFSWTASVIIALSALATVLSEMRFRSTSAACGDLILIAGVLLIVEWVGVTTGIPFGEYRYTDALGFRIAGVPVAVTFAWYTTIVNAVRISEHLWNGHRAAVALSAAFITVSLDLALEPMASFVQGYWIWNGGTVPLMNYGAWFLLSLLGGIRVTRSGASSGETRHTLFRVGLLLGALQFSLFVVTDLVHGYILPVVAALGLLGIVVLGKAMRINVPLGRRSIVG